MLKAEDCWVIAYNLYFTLNTHMFSYQVTNIPGDSTCLWFKKDLGIPQKTYKKLLGKTSRQYNRNTSGFGQQDGHTYLAFQYYYFLESRYSHLRNGNDATYFVKIFLKVTDHLHKFLTLMAGPCHILNQGIIQYFTGRQHSLKC